LRFRLREAPRPLELERLLSRGAWVEESLSTRLDSVRAPDRLCVDEDLLEPEERPFDEDERPFDEDERPFDFELLEPLLFDRDFCWGILPRLLLESLTCSALTRIQPFKHARIHPFKHVPEPTVQIPSTAGSGSKPPARNRSWHGKPREARNNGADNAILEQKLIARQLEDEE
jgi:hypothetical protein